MCNECKQVTERIRDIPVVDDCCRMRDHIGYAESLLENIGRLFTREEALVVSITDSEDPDVVASDQARLNRTRHELRNVLTAVVNFPSITKPFERRMVCLGNS